MTSLQISLNRITLELAREPDHPQGDPADRYTLVVPLDETAHIDAAGWKAAKIQCSVIKEAAREQPVVGRLVHGPGGRWLLCFEDKGRTFEEAGFRFDSERFVIGEYLSIERADGVHVFRVVGAEPVRSDP